MIFNIDVLIRYDILIYTNFISNYQIKIIGVFLLDSLYKKNQAIYNFMLS
jgi:hypothetical protein